MEIHPKHRIPNTEKKPTTDSTCRRVFTDGHEMFHKQSPSFRHGIRVPIWRMVPPHASNSIASDSTKATGYPIQTITPHFCQSQNTINFRIWLFATVYLSQKFLSFLFLFAQKESNYATFVKAISADGSKYYFNWIVLRSLVHRFNFKLVKIQWHLTLFGLFSFALYKAK